MNGEQNALASSGIEALIQKLRQQGVDTGRAEAAQILRDAEAEAELLLKQAQTQAEHIVSEARREAARHRQAGEDALRMAARDLQLEVKESLARSFSDQVERLVEQQMDDAEFMRRMILELVGQARAQAELDQAPEVEVLLPDHIIGLDELRRHASEYRQGRLSQFVQSLSAGLLREGVRFDTHNGRGLRVRLLGSEVEVDLSDSAVASLLLRHLQPRFRALLEGVIR
jgi:V/A-type H+-transporting ATPase subunit E